MPRGYCPACNRLVEIVPRGLRKVDRGLPSVLTGQCAWFPVRHPKIGDDTGGEDCPGVKEEIR